MAIAKYDRVLLKLSGDFMSGESGFGIDPATVEGVAEQVRLVATECQVQIAIVIGGGNIWRGSSAMARGMERPG